MSSTKKVSKKEIKKESKKERKYKVSESQLSDNETNELDDVAKKYQKKSQLEHIKDLPDTYIGSTVKEFNSSWNLLSNDKLHITNREFE